jgi:tRNA (guanine-N7-)-methyltransferase
VRRSQRLPLDQLAPYLLPTPTEPVSLSWNEVFGNYNPVEIEVGFGKGLFLVNASQACPAVNFLGIEIIRKYQLLTATRLAKRALTNVRLACADARTFLRDFIGPEAVRAIHIYFPDPWWKKRHHKRRVFTASFVRECERVLRVGGRMHVATDVEEYFGEIIESVARNTGLQSVPPPRAAAPSHDLDYLTNFERKARKDGRAIYRAAYERQLIV